MTKILKLLLFSVLSIACFAEGFNIKFGRAKDQIIGHSGILYNTYVDSLYDDYNSTENYTEDIEYEKKYIIDLSFDYEVAPQIEVGIGVGLTSTLSRKEGEEAYFSEDYAFRTTYSQIKVNLNGEGTINPYLISKFGFSWVKFYEEHSDLDTESGNYSAAGAGIEYGPFIFEMIYENLNSTVFVDGNSFDSDDNEYNYSGRADLSYERMTVLVGVNVGRIFK